MNQTIFEFSLKRTSDAVNDEIVEQIETLPGVIDVTRKSDDLLIEIGVTVEFENSDDAIRKHKNIVKAIKSAREYFIISIKTNLTDVFDGS